MSSQRLNKNLQKKTFCIKAEGESMRPLLFTGDIIEYRKISFSQVSINDIVLTYRRGIFMTHRVIYKTDRYIITRGDNNRKADEKMFANNIMGKVLRFKRNGAWHTIEEQYIAQSMYYLKEVQRISGKLQTLNIPHVFIKGVMTSLKHYGKLPQRIYADCDLLIHREDFSTVRSIYEAEGYTFLQNQQSLVLKSKDSTPKFEGDFYKKVDTTPVYFDVHLEPVFLMTKLGGMDYLYRDTLRRELGAHFIENCDYIKFDKNERYPVCSITDQILYLSLHFFHHNLTDITRLNFLHDIVVKNKRKIDWSSFYEQVAHFSLGAYVFPVLLLLRKYYKTPIPEYLLKNIDPRGYKRKALDFAIKNNDIFSEDSRLRSGILRFILIFLVSPEPFYRKAVLLIHPSVILSVLWVVYMKIRIRLHIRRE